MQTPFVFRFWFGYFLGFNTLIQVANKYFETIRTAQMNVTRCVSRVLKYLPQKAFATFDKGEN